MQQFFGEPELPRGLDAFFPKAPPPPLQERLQEHPAVPQEPVGKTQVPKAPAPSEPLPSDLRDNLPEAILGEAFRAVMDFVLPPLPLSEQVTYLWLFRYAYGFGRNHCQVSRPALMRVTGLSKRGVDLALSRLETRGWIQTIAVNYRQGTSYRVYLPHERLGSPPGSPYRLLDSQLLSRELQSKLPTAIEREKEIETLSQKSSQLHSSSLLSSQHRDSQLEQLLDKFYAGLGQRRISSLKREKGLAVLADLLQDGYTLEEIAYAIDWVVASIPKLHSISILPEIMGQALAARERFLAQTGSRPHPKERAEETKEREQQEKEQRRIEEIKASLSSERLSELHEEARKLLEQEKPNLNFGQEILIRLKVNELIKQKYLESSVRHEAVRHDDIKAEWSTDP